MTADLLITGGTGTLGRLLVPRLRDAGAELRVLSRHPGDHTVVGDLTTGEGVDAAVDGIRTIVHCAGTAKGDDRKAETLVRAARAAGVRHIVFISVVGADRAGFGYYAAKRRAEEVIAGSGIGWRTLRATQFHELALTVVRGLTKLPLALVPAGVRVQPVDAGEVADRLAELALGEPAGRVPDLGGPRVYGVDDLVRGYLAATGRRRPIVRVRLAGRAYRAMRDGANLAPDHATGVRTWEDFLAAGISREGAGRFRLSR